MSSPHKKGIIQLDGICYKVNNSSGKAAIIESPTATRHIQIPATITDTNQRTFNITEILHAAFEGAKIRSIHFSPDSEITIIGSNTFGLGATSPIETIELPPKISVLRDDWCFNTPRVKSIQLSSKNENYILTDNENNQIQSAKSNKDNSQTTEAKNETEEDKEANNETNNNEASTEKDNEEEEVINQGCILYNSDKTVLYFVCRNIKRLIIPNTVKRIASSACQFAQIEELVFEEGSQLEEIERSAFFGCKLTSINNLPKSVRIIGDFAFNSNRSLEKVTFEEGSKLQYIGVGAFASCGLKGRNCFICPSDQISKIGKGCFENNKKLIYVVFENAKILEVGSNAFKDTAKRPLSGIVLGSKTKLKGKGVPTNQFILNEGETVADIKDVYKSEIGKSDDEEEEEEANEEEEKKIDNPNSENINIEIEEEEEDDELEKALLSLEDDGEDINLLDPSYQDMKSRDVDILLEINDDNDENNGLDELDKDQQIEKLKSLLKSKDEQNKQLLKKLEKMKKIIFLLNKEVNA